MIGYPDFPNPNNTFVILSLREINYEIIVINNDSNYPVSPPMQQEISMPNHLCHK